MKSGRLLIRPNAAIIFSIALFFVYNKAQVRQTVANGRARERVPERRVKNFLAANGMSEMKINK